MRFKAPQSYIGGFTTPQSARSRRTYARARRGDSWPNSSPRSRMRASRSRSGKPKEPLTGMSSSTRWSRFLVRSKAGCRGSAPTISYAPGAAIAMASAAGVSVFNMAIAQTVIELEHLAALLRRRNEIDAEIGAAIGRPPTSGHLGEYVAAVVFGIKLEASAAAKGIDG